MPLPLSSVVSVDVILSAPGIPRSAQNVPLIVSNTGNAAAWTERVREYDISAGLDGVEADFATTTPEYQAAAAIAAQPNPPDVIKIGKGTLKPTKALEITPTAVNSTLYKINVYADGRAWDAEYTSDASATVQEIVEGLVAKLTPPAWTSLTSYSVGDRATNDSGKVYECTKGGTSAGAGGPTGTGAAITDATVTWSYVATPNFTATEDNTKITATGNAAGNWFALEPVASTSVDAVSDIMTMSDTTTDPGIATDLTAILAADPNWYALLLLFNGKAIVSTSGTGASAWCASNKRLFLCCTADTPSAATAYSGAVDALAVLAGQASSYTAGYWHPREQEWLACCVAGYFLPIDPGGDNWTLKELTGPTPVNLTSTQIGYLEDRRAGFYVELGATGTSVIAGNGKVMSTSYGYIDLRRGIDWYTANLQADLVDLLLANNKLPNTTAGRRVIANKIAARNDAGIAAGVISPDALDPMNPQAPIMTPYVVTVPPVSDTSSFTASTRALSGVSTRWRYANPIDSIGVTVNVAQ